MLSASMKKTAGLFAKQSRTISTFHNFGDFENHGFLPEKKPLLQLPSEFSMLDELLTKMRFHDEAGNPNGLLAKNEFRKAVDSDLPNLLEALKKTDPLDGRLNSALFRDFGFLMAAYLLEPTHLSWLNNGGDYGHGMNYLPENIA